MSYNNHDLLREESKNNINDEIYGKIAKVTIQLLDEIEELENKLCNLLSSFTKIDMELCTLMNRGNDYEGMIGEEYEKHMDIAIEIEEFLKKRGRYIK